MSKKKSRKAALQEANLKLTFVPVVFIVLRVWGTLRFLMGSLAHYDAPWISYLQVSYFKLILQFRCLYRHLAKTNTEFWSKPIFFFKDLVTQNTYFWRTRFTKLTNYILEVVNAVTSSSNPAGKMTSLRCRRRLGVQAKRCWADTCTNIENICFGRHSQMSKLRHVNTFEIRLNYCQYTLFSMLGFI